MMRAVKKGSDKEIEVVDIDGEIAVTITDGNSEAIICLSTAEARQVEQWIRSERVRIEIERGES